MKKSGFISNLINNMRKWLGWCPKTPKLTDNQKTTRLQFALGKPRLMAIPIVLATGYLLVYVAIGFLLFNIIYPATYNSEQYYIQSFVGTTVIFLIDPVLLFTVSYFLEKRLNLEYDFISIIISLFLGSLIVYVPFAIYSGAFAISPTVSLRSLFVTISECMKVFLVSFAGMAVAYLKRRNISFHEFRLGIGLHNLRINWKILAWTMSSLIIVEGFISFAEFYLINVAGSLDLFYNQYSPLLSIVKILIYPILFVFILYLIGRNLDIEALSTIVFSLLIGCFVGLIIGNLIYYLSPLGFTDLERLFNQLETVDIMAISYVCFDFIYSLIYHFILGLSALAIGSLHRFESTRN